MRHCLCRLSEIKSLSINRGRLLDGGAMLDDNVTQQQKNLTEQKCLEKLTLSFAEFSKQQAPSTPQPFRDRVKKVL